MRSRFFSSHVDAVGGVVLVEAAKRPAKKAGGRPFRDKVIPTSQTKFKAEAIPLRRDQPRVAFKCRPHDVSRFFHPATVLADQRPDP